MAAAAPPKFPDKSENLSAESREFNEYELKCQAAIETELGEERVRALSRTILTRFIRGYAKEEPDPIKETINRLRECLEWRAKVGADTIIERLSADKEFMLELAEFRKRWPTGIYGCDRHGRPVQIDRVGLIDPAKVFEVYPMEKIELFHIFQMEQVNRYKDDLARNYGTVFYKQVVVIDLHDFGARHMGAKLRDPMKAMLHIDQHYYPESLHKMVVANAPWAFRMLWAIVSPWVHPATKARILMGKEHLWEHVDFDQVPKFIEHGTMEDEPKSDQWLEDFHRESLARAEAKKADAPQAS